MWIVIGIVVIWLLVCVIKGWLSAKNEPDMDAAGNMQHCGVEAELADSSEFTYLGNGEVTFKVCSKDGTSYTQKISFSVDEEKVNFVSEAIE